MLALGLGAGLGLSALGGITQAIGAGQQGDAYQDAANLGLRAARGLQRENASINQYGQQQYEPMQNQYNELLTQALQAYDTRPELLAARPQAGQTLQQGADQFGGMIRQPVNYMQAGGAPNVGVQQALAARYRPMQQLQQEQVARASILPQVAGQQSGIADALGALQRQNAAVGRDQGLMQALAGQQYGTQMADYQSSLANAAYAGQGLQALGGWFQGMAPGIATALGTLGPSGGGPVDMGGTNQGTRPFGSFVDPRTGGIYQAA